MNEPSKPEISKDPRDAKDPGNAASSKPDATEIPSHVAEALISAAGQVIGSMVTGHAIQTASQPRKGSVDHYKQYFLNNKWFAPFILFVIFIIACGAFVKGIERIWSAGNYIINLF